MAEKPQNIGTIFPENVDSAPQAADFDFNVFESRGDAVFHAVETELNLFDVSTDSRRFNADPIFQPNDVALSRHLITHRFDGAGDVAYYIFVVRVSQRWPGA